VLQAAHTYRGSVSPAGTRNSSADEPQWLQNFTAG
jgi:hypothetical protein